MTAAGSRAEDLKAAFSSALSYSTYYSQDFDTEEDFATWTVNTTNSKATWMLAPGIGYNISFQTIDPDSKNSLAIFYSREDQDETVTSPEIDIRPNSVVEYYNWFSPGLLLFGSYTFYATDVATGDTVQFLNQFLWAQETAYDEKAWKRFNFDLKRLEGKRVTFSFRYKGNDGEDQLIDGFKVMQVDDSDDAKVTVYCGDKVQFLDSSAGNVKMWKWQFEGATPAISSEQNPTVTYSKAGTYGVRLTVGDGTTTDTAVREGYVTVMQQQPNALIGMPEEGYLSPFAATFIPTGVPVTFRDLSTGMPTAWKWQFVGGTPETSEEQNPTVKYMKTGSYSLSLTASNEAGSDDDIMLYAVQAGGAQYVWNIDIEEQSELCNINFGQFGNYAGSNWLGLTAFAEHFSKPLAAATIDSVDIYFYSNHTISPGADITLSICAPDADGAPGNVLSSTVIKAGDIQCDPTAWVPTRFVLPTPAEVTTDFFVVIAGFPNAASDTAPYDSDDISIACVKRDSGQRSTAWQLVEEEDNQGNPTGTSRWYENTDDPVSMAVCPVVTYDKPTSPSAISTVEASGGKDKPAYTPLGMRVKSMKKGQIYIRDGRKSVF